MNEQTDAELQARAAELDRQLAALLAARGETAQALAVRGLADPSADAGWVAATAAASGRSPLPATASDAVLRELRSGIAALAHPRRVVFLGPLFSYSHLAALERFGQSAEMIPVVSIAAVFDEVQRGHADFGLVPLENSTDGRVTDTLTCFARSPQRICGEVRVPIRHNLLARCSRDQITRVCSKPQALSQCRDWLATHLPDAELVETASTTAAAEMAAHTPGCAAVASREAGVQYDLPIVAANIADHPDNVTRFAVIGAAPSPPTGADKCSLMFELPHKPGALADALLLLKSHKLNMTWIESFPLRSRAAEYLFFVELEGHQEDAEVANVIAELRQQAVVLEVLGSYPAAS